MAKDSLASLVVDLQVESAQMRAQLGTVNRQLKAFGDKANQASRSAAQGFTVLKGVMANLATVLIGQLAGGLANSVKLYAQTEKAQLMLAAAAEQMGYAAAEVVPALEAQADALERNLGVSADTVNQVQQLQLRFGVAPKDIDRTTKALFDYAAASKQDAQAATMQLLKAVETGADGISRLGIKIKATGDKSTDLNLIVDAMAEKFGGAAAASAQTLSGQMEILQQDIEEVQKTMAAVALAGANAASQWWLGVDALKALSEAARGVKLALETGFSVTGAVKGAFGSIKLSNLGNPLAMASGALEGGLGSAELPGAKRQAELNKLTEQRVALVEKLSNAEKREQEFFGQETETVTRLYNEAFREMMTYSRQLDELTGKINKLKDASQAAGKAEAGITTLGGKGGRSDTHKRGARAEFIGPKYDPAAIAEYARKIANDDAKLRRATDEWLAAAEMKDIHAAGVARRKEFLNSVEFARAQWKGTNPLPGGTTPRPGAGGFDMTPPPPPPPPPTPPSWWDELRAQNVEQGNRFALSLMDLSETLADGAVGVANAVGNLIGQMGGLGSAVKAGIEGFKSGGIWGAFIAVIADLLKSTKAFQRAIDIGNGSMKSIVPKLEGLAASLQPLLTAIGMVVSTILDLLQPVFEGLGEVFSGVSQLVASFATSLKPLAPLMRFIGDSLKPLGLLFEGLGRAVAGIGYLILGAAYGIGNGVNFFLRAIGAQQLDLSGIKALRDQFADEALHGTANAIAATSAAWEAAAKPGWDVEGSAARWASAHEAHAAASTKAAAALKRFSEQVTNAPTGFRANAARYAAQDPGGNPGGAGGSGSEGTLSARVHGDDIVFMVNRGQRRTRARDGEGIG